MSKKQKRSLADPTSLNPRSDDCFQVIIETPKGYRNKYGYDPGQGIFTLRKVLPKAWCFPTILVSFHGPSRPMAIPSTFSC